LIDKATFGSPFLLCCVLPFLAESVSTYCSA
jgi:hypothetical protein